MPNLYYQHSSDPKENAQRNLKGRTHYVDDDSLRYHHSRIITANHYANSLLFGIVVSDALDHQNTKRGFRFVVFNLFGTVVERTPLEQAFRRSGGELAMSQAIIKLDAIGLTLAAIDAHVHFHAQEMDQLRSKLGSSLAPPGECSVRVQGNRAGRHHPYPFDRLAHLHACCDDGAMARRLVRPARPCGSRRATCGINEPHHGRHRDRRS